MGVCVCEVPLMSLTYAPVELNAFERNEPDNASRTADPLLYCILIRLWKGRKRTPWIPTNAHTLSAE